jgi:enoyl-CoA hydratase/3-hydroxyacyl-CoA dehydrogenase
MIFFPVVNEACRVLDEGIAVKSADLDISAVMGMGFPPYRFVSSITFFTHSKVFASCSDFFDYLIRGGIIFWADSLGSKSIYSRLAEWSKLYGEFFKPSAYLAARAAKGIPLVRNLRSCVVCFIYRSDSCLLGCILFLFTKLRYQFGHCHWSRIFFSIFILIF